MFPELTSEFQQWSPKEVTDAFVTALYDQKILDDWKASAAVIRTGEDDMKARVRIGPYDRIAPRQVTFYKADCGYGLQFECDGYIARAFLNRARDQGFKSSFDKKTGQGFIEMFHIAGMMERMSGLWIPDEVTGQDVFFRDDSLNHTLPFARDEHVPAYNKGFHLSYFLNKHWSKKNREPA